MSAPTVATNALRSHTHTPNTEKQENLHFTASVKLFPAVRCIPAFYLGIRPCCDTSSWRISCLLIYVKSKIHSFVLDACTVLLTLVLSVGFYLLRALQCCRQRVRKRDSWWTSCPPGGHMKQRADWFAHTGSCSSRAPERSVLYHHFKSLISTG